MNIELLMQFLQEAGVQFPDGFSPAQLAKILTQVSEVPPKQGTAIDEARLAELISEKGVEVPKSSRPRCGNISRLTYCRLVLACEATEKSEAQALQTALLTYLERNAPRHEQALRFEAAINGMSLEEYLVSRLENRK